MTTAEWAMIVAPIVVFFAVVTAWQTRRWITATRYLSSTLGCAPSSTSNAPQRLACGISVLRPGRLVISHPLCKVEVSPEALVVYGPMGGRMAEFCSAAEYVSVVADEPPSPPLLITTSHAKVSLYVRRTDEPVLQSWLAQAAGS